MTTRTHTRIGIIGSGVVGQATGRGFLARGLAVTFVDIRPETVAKLRQEGLTAYTPTELTRENSDWEITFLTVSTPTDAATGEINLSHLESAVIDVGRRLAERDAYHVVVVRSTVVPGTTEGLVLQTLEQASGKKVGADFGLCMNPEYLREKSAVDDFLHPWLVVIGEYDKRSGDALEAIYADIDCPIHRVTLVEAEMQKYVHNLFNAVKITFFNEMRGIAVKLGARAEVMFPLVAKSAEGMWEPTYGIKDFGPFDGMCLPKDTQAFLRWAQEHGWKMPLLKTAIVVNNELLEGVTEMTPGKRLAIGHDAQQPVRKRIVEPVATTRLEVQEPAPVAVESEA